MKIDSLIAFIVIALLVSFLSLRYYGKYSLCKTYYSEMSLIACFSTDVYLPAKGK